MFDANGFGQKREIVGAEPFITDKKSVSSGTSASSNSIRRLQGTERVVAIGNAEHAGTFDLVSVGLLEGPWTLERLERSLHLICTRNPILRTDVRPDPGKAGEWCFVSSPVPPVIQEVERTDSDTWKEVWEQSCDTPVTGRSWRVTWVRQQGSAQSELIVGFHHALADGRSLQLFFKQLAQACAQHEDETYNEYIPPSVMSVAQPKASFGVLKQLLSLSMKGRLRMPQVNTDPVKPEDRLWRSEFRTISSSALIARCQQENTTVGAAVGAAMRLAGASSIGEDSVRLSFTDLMDLRGRLGDYSADMIGDIIVAYINSYKVNPLDDVWDVARQVQQTLEKAIESGGHKNWTLMPQFLGYKVQQLFSSKSNGRSPYSAFMLSNIGRIAAIDTDEFKVKQIFSTSKQAQWGSVFSMSTNTVGERMSLHLGYASPVVSQQQAQNFIDGVLARLEITALD